MNLPDSSYYYPWKALRIDSTNQMTRSSHAELYGGKTIRFSVEYLLEPIEHFREENDRWDLIRVLLDAAKTYEKKNENQTALQYALENFSIAQKANAKHYMPEGYLLLSRLNNHL